MIGTITISKKVWDSPIWRDTARELLDNGFGKGEGGKGALFTEEELTRLIRCWMIGSDDWMPFVFNRVDEMRIADYEKFLDTILKYRISEEILQILIKGVFVCRGIKEDDELDLLQIQFEDE